MKESTVKNGFYEIVGYSRYLISKSGVVYDLRKELEVRPWINSSGYFNFTLTADNGERYIWGRHRLVLFVFKPLTDIKGLHVNHINGLKGDDRLENLEWCTVRGNFEHAARIGLSEQCVPVSTRHVISGEVCEFASMARCAEAYGISKDVVSWRVRCGEGRVFLDGRQYRVGKGDLPWVEVMDPKRSIALAVPSKPVQIRDIDTGALRQVESLKALSVMTGLLEGPLSERLNHKHHPVVCGKYQIKWLSDIRPWRPIENCEAERVSFKGSRRIAVVDSEGVVRTFQSGVECAREMGIKVTTLSERLKVGSSRPAKDGFFYTYQDQ